jgi:hypothetical protein
MLDWLNEFKWFLGNICLATFAGFVRGIGCERGKFTWWGLAQRVLAAMLIGVIATLILAHAEIPETMKTAIAGGAGYSANDILESLKPWVKKRLGLWF